MIKSKLEKPKTEMDTSKTKRYNILESETSFPRFRFWVKMFALSLFLNFVLDWHVYTVFTISLVIIAISIRTRSHYPSGPPHIYGTSEVIFRSIYRVFSVKQDEEEARKYEERIHRKLEDLMDAQEGQGLCGFSCRVLFDMFLRSRVHFDGSKKKVLITPFQHTSFPKSIGYNELELVVIDIDENNERFILNESEFDASEFAAVVVTHALGYPFDVDNVVAWANKHNIPVFEDAVQANLFPIYKGHPGASIVAFSGGVDKIPVSFGGGFAIVRDPEVRALLNAELEQLPRQGPVKRFVKLLEALILWVIYRHQIITWCLHIYCGIVKMSITDFCWMVRKNVSGFVHERHKYLRRPSVAQLASMDDSLDIDWVPFHQRMTEKRYRVRELIGEEVSEYFFPWDRSFGESAFYYHFWVDDALEFIEFMNQCGMNVMVQQSWYIPDAPNAREVIKRLVIVPSVFPSTESQLRNFANEIIPYAKKYMK